MCCFLGSIFHFFSSFFNLLPCFCGFPGGSNGKESSCNVGDWGLSLGQEDPLREEMATHSSILAWKIPWTEESGRLQFMGSQWVRHDWVTNTFIFSRFCRTYPSVTYWEKVHAIDTLGPYMSENVFILLQSWLFWVVLDISEEFL